jgi:hypothetical protein
MEGLSHHFSLAIAKSLDTDFRESEHPNYRPGDGLGVGVGDGSTVGLGEASGLGETSGLGEA